MRQRKFIALLGAAAAPAWPSRAQQPAMPVVGYLGSTSLSVVSDTLPGFHQGLREAGYVEGRNLALEFRYADGNYDRLPALAKELLARRASVILAAALPATVAAKAATATIPIVFVVGADPVKQGIVASFAQPGGNITGVTQFFGVLGGKRLELLRDLVPATTTIAVLSNPRNPNAGSHLDDVQAAAGAMGKRTEVLLASSAAEIDAAFDGLARLGAGAALIADDPLFSVRAEQIVALAARHGVPTIYYARLFVAAGGLISYGSSSRENLRLAGGYVGRILKGAKPSELPVLQPTTFELVINLKTARSLGVTVPAALVARADEVIE